MRPIVATKVFGLPVGKELDEFDDMKPCENVELRRNHESEPILISFAWRCPV